MEENKISISFITTASVVFITICGCLWHLGYWSTFQFNFLEYASITDLFKSSIYPFFAQSWIFLSLIIFNIGLSFISAAAPLNRTRIRTVTTQPGRWANAFINLLIGISGFVTFLYTGLIHPPVGLKILPLSLGIFFGLLLFQTGILKSNIKDYSLRAFALVSLTLYPSYNFFLAKRQSIEIISGLRYKNVFFINTGDTLMDKRLKGTAYLGNTANYMFFNFSQKVIAVKSDLIKEVVFETKVVDSNYKYFVNYPPF